MNKPQHQPFFLDRHRQAGTRRRVGAALASTVMIEGEPVTVAQIAARIGVGPDAAGKRLKREQAKPGRVTWAGLQA